MSKKVNKKSEHRCNICNKKYSIKYSLWNHIKKCHINTGPLKSEESPLKSEKSPKTVR